MQSVIIMVTVAVTFLTLDVQSTMVSDHLAYKIVNVFSARASIITICSSPQQQRHVAYCHTLLLEPQQELRLCLFRHGMIASLRQLMQIFPLGTASNPLFMYVHTHLKHVKMIICLQVGTNGYFTFDGFTGYRAFLFNERNQSLVAPYFTDIDISVGVGQIQYEVHTGATSEEVLSQVNELINQCSEKEFKGNWLLVATWENVPWYGGSTSVVSVCNR